MSPYIIAIIILVVMLVIWIVLRNKAPVMNMEYPGTRSSNTNKVALLIESTGGTEADVSSVESARLAAKISNIPLEVYDTKGSIQTTLSLLDQLYSQGYRNFVGFNRSAILEQAIPWFKRHPDTRVISPLSSASSLISNDNIIRMSPSNKTVFEGLLSAFSDDYDRALAVVQKNDLYAADALNIITNASTNTVLDPIIIESIVVDLSNPADRQRLMQKLNKLDKTTVVIPLSDNQMPQFRTVASSSTGTFDVMEAAGIVPTLPNGFMPGRYNIFLPRISTTREGVEIASGIDNFSLPTYEAIVLAGSSREAKISLCGPNNIIPLDMNQDREVSIFLVQVWSGTEWQRVGVVGAKPSGGGYFQSAF